MKEAEHGALPGKSFYAVFSLEPLDPAPSVDNLLLPGKERMALGTYFNPQILFCRPRFKNRTTGAANLSLIIFGMNTLLHIITSFHNHLANCYIIT
jgi:hypothetical protein